VLALALAAAAVTAAVVRMVVSVFMGMVVGVHMGLLAAGHMIVIDMHNGSSLQFSFSIIAMEWASVKTFIFHGISPGGACAEGEKRI